MYDDILQGEATKKSAIFEPPFGRTVLWPSSLFSQSLTMHPHRVAIVRLESGQRTVRPNDSMCIRDPNTGFFVKVVV